MYRAFRQALRAQRAVRGYRTAPSVSELYDLAVKKRFGGPMTQVHNEYLATGQGRTAVIDHLRVENSIGSEENVPTMRRYFGGLLVHDEPRGYLGSRVMSSVLQLSYLFENTAELDTPSDSLSGDASSSPEDGDRKCLSIGETETEGKQGLVQDAFENSKPLKLMLLLNKLLGTEFYQHLKHVALSPYEFEMSDVDRVSDCERPLRRITRKAQTILAVLKPALTVNINSHVAVGGITDISVRVDALDQDGVLQTEYPAIIQLNKPCSAYRAANILAFGGALNSTDETALRSPIDSSKAPKLESTLSQLQSVDGSLLKHTVNRIDGNLVSGYSRDGEDVTESLSHGYLRYSLDALHSGLEQAARTAALNGCRHMAVSDGFTFIGTHLRELTEVHDNLVEANFNSHYALDLTEDGSSVKMMRYIIDAAPRSERVRWFIQMLLEAAGEHFGGAEISDAKAAEFKLLIEKEFKDFRFDFIRDTSLVPSGRLFTKHRVSLVQNALAKFGQEYGAIAVNGEYKSSDFGIIEYYRSDMLLKNPNPESSTIPILGRSRSVAKVQFCGDDDAIGGEQSNGPGVLSQRPFVLKVYDADPWSILQMERELKAYFRTSQLVGADQKSVAKLLAFGAIDLEDVDPRLFIALEYVERVVADTPSYYEYLESAAADTLSYEEYVESATTGRPSEEAEENELARVCNILNSVGVRHNDLKERNYRWQLDDGKWFIKVFDFDHATFDDVFQFSR